jgi:hypothetical protein
LILSPKTFLFPIVLLTLGVFVAFLWQDWTQLDVGHFTRAASYSLSAAALGYYAIIRWLWRLRPFNGFAVRVPDLEGTWKGESVRSSGSGAERRDTVTMRIRQPSLFEVHCEFEHDDEHVRSLTQACRFYRESAGGIGLIAVFQVQKDADAAQAHGTPEQYRGAVQFELRPEPDALRPEHMIGRYWTDAHTSGRLKLQRVWASSRRIRKKRRLHGNIEVVQVPRNAGGAPPGAGERGTLEKAE